MVITNSSETLVLQVHESEKKNSSQQQQQQQSPLTKSLEQVVLGHPNLLPAEAVPRPALSKIHNQNRYKYYEFRVKGSILPSVALYVGFATVWATLITCLYFLAGWKSLAVSNFIIAILSIVVGLTLVFRTNTAYDRYSFLSLVVVTNPPRKLLLIYRYWEARKLWATLKTHCRNLGRFIFIVANNRNLCPKDIEERMGAINLLAALPVAIKHQLRQENGIYYEGMSDTRQY